MDTVFFEMAPAALGRPPLSPTPWGLRDYNTDPIAFMYLNSMPAADERVYIKRDGNSWRFVPKVAAMKVFLDAVRRCPELDEPYIRVAFRKRCTKVFDALMEKHCTTLSPLMSRGFKQGYVIPDMTMRHTCGFSIYPWELFHPQD